MPHLKSSWREMSSQPSKWCLPGLTLWHNLYKLKTHSFEFWVCIIRTEVRTAPCFMTTVMYHHFWFMYIHWYWTAQYWVHTTKNLIKSQLYSGILHESQLIHICLWFYEKGWFFSVAAPHPIQPNTSIYILLIRSKKLIFWLFANLFLHDCTALICKKCDGNIWKWIWKWMWKWIWKWIYLEKGAQPHKILKPDFWVRFRVVQTAITRFGGLRDSKNNSIVTMAVS